jgi:microfibrillar-associated protein 1
LVKFAFFEILEMSDTDSDEDDARPLFVPKSQRATLMKEKANAENDKNDKARKARAYVLESVTAASTEFVPDSYDSETDLPSIGDSDPELEFQAWKIRELNRMQRDNLEREFVIKERRELLERRAVADDSLLFDSTTRIMEQGEKRKWKFLQKYYHKGVFYMDSSSVSAEADVRKKDYSEPTLEDRIDKEKLPQIMQVKNFGKKGRTKYTHLVDQDTSLKDNKRVNYKIDQRLYDSIKSKKRKI